MTNLDPFLQTKKNACQLISWRQYIECTFYSESIHGDSSFPLRLHKEEYMLTLLTYNFAQSCLISTLSAKRRIHYKINNLSKRSEEILR